MARQVKFNESVNAKWNPRTPSAGSATHSADAGDDQRIFSKGLKKWLTLTNNTQGLTATCMAQTAGTPP